VLLLLLLLLAWVASVTVVLCDMQAVAAALWLLQLRTACDAMAISLFQTFRSSSALHSATLAVLLFAGTQQHCGCL
jgi:hypothetical protein